MPFQYIVRHIQGLETIGCNHTGQNTHTHTHTHTRARAKGSTTHTTGTTLAKSESTHRLRRGIEGKAQALTI
jgi:hypothetical protein